MAKTETVHTRVTPEIKNKADKIFTSLGLTTSQAIMLFLNATVNCNGLPFELRIDNSEEDYRFAKVIATVDGVEPSEDAERIMKLYSKGEIDYETACSRIKELFAKYEVNNEK